MTARHRRVAAVLFVVGLLLRLGHVASTEFVPVADELEWEYLGHSLAAGTPYDSGPPRIHLAHSHTGVKPFQLTAWRTPGLPIFLAIIYRSVAPTSLPTRVALVVLNSAVSVVLYLLGAELFDSRVGLAAGVMWALWPMSIYHGFSSDRVMGESLAIPLYATGVWLTIRGLRRASLGWIAIGASSLGYAILTRGHVAPGVLLVAAALPFVRPELPVSFRVQSAAVFSGAVALVLTPWLVRNYLVMGSFALSTQTVVLYQGNNPLARGSVDMSDWSQPHGRQMQYILDRHPGFELLSETQKAAIYRSETLQFFLHEPGRIAKLFVRKAVVFFTPFYVGTRGHNYNFAFVLALPFFFAGVLSGLSTRGPAWIAFLAILGVLLTCLLTFSDDRYRSMAEPFMLLFAALAISRFVGWAGARNAGAVLALWFAANVAVFLWQGGP